MVIYLSDTYTTFELFTMLDCCNAHYLPLQHPTQGVTTLKNDMDNIMLKGLRMSFMKGLEVVGMAELVNQALASLRFLHNSFLVILSKRTRELVIIHGWSVLKRPSVKVEI